MRTKNRELLSGIAAFVEEYRPQLEWYAVALRELTGKPVKESWLYALSVDKAYKL